MCSLDPSIYAELLSSYYHSMVGVKEVFSNDRTRMISRIKTVQLKKGENQTEHEIEDNCSNHKSQIRTSLVLYTPRKKSLNHVAFRNALDLLGEAGAFTFHFQQGNIRNVNLDERIDLGESYIHGEIFILITAVSGLKLEAAS